jgi:hypothetical protein
MYFLIVLVSETVNSYKGCANVVNFGLPEKKTNLFGDTKSHPFLQNWRDWWEGLQQVSVRKAFSANNTMVEH